MGRGLLGFAARLEVTGRLAARPACYSSLLFVGGFIVAKSPFYCVLLIQSVGRLLLTMATTSVDNITDLENRMDFVERGKDDDEFIISP